MTKEETIEQSIERLFSNADGDTATHLILWDANDAYELSGRFDKDFVRDALSQVYEAGKIAQAKTDLYRLTEMRDFAEECDDLNDVLEIWIKDRTAELDAREVKK